MIDAARRLQVDPLVPGQELPNLIQGLQVVRVELTTILATHLTGQPGWRAGALAPIEEHVELHYCSARAARPCAEAADNQYVPASQPARQEFP